MGVKYYRVKLGMESIRRVTLHKYDGFVGEHIRSDWEQDRNGVDIHVAVLRLADGISHVFVPFAEIRSATEREILEFLTAQVIQA